MTDSFDFNKFSNMTTSEMKLLCDGTVLLYVKCIDKFNIDKSHNCYDNFNHVFNCMRVLEKKQKK